MNKTTEQLNSDTLFAFQMALKGHKQFEWQSEVSGNWLKTHTVTPDRNHRIYHDLPKEEGWTRHAREDWKGDKDAVIEGVMFCDGRVSKGESNAVYWADHYASSFTREDPKYRIYAYKLAKPAVSIPDGFTKWEGGECPVSPETMVEYIMRRVTRVNGPDIARDLKWKHLGLEFDIIAYRVIEKKVVPWTIEEINLRVGQVVKSTNPTNPCRCVITETNGVMVWIGGDMIARTPEYLMTYFLQLNGEVCGTEEV